MPLLALAALAEAATAVHYLDDRVGCWDARAWAASWHRDYCARTSVRELANPREMPASRVLCWAVLGRAVELPCRSYCRTA